ncbi:uncharacterized protein [Rutidosis leptorrhynchoides]|uniref:uncharacterized protein n=1 Tax=Rutidosis leptorrhynchoides TaxID=125765 RepID=UPI003A99A5F9
MKIISLNIRDFCIGTKHDKSGWVRKLMLKEKPCLIVLQETRLNLVEDRWIFSIWGSYDCDFVQKEKVGNSGGQLIIWDKNCFEASSVFNFDCAIGVKGVWKDNQKVINILNIYGPHDDASKIKLWDLLSTTIDGSDEAWVLGGDFNEVREKDERLNCEFVEYRARRFNDFIANNSLIEIPLGGRNFTRVSEDGIKFSKLDLFLVNERFQQIWNDLSVVALDRERSDHCVIILKDEEKNFGPKSFKIFYAWLNEEDVDQIIGDAWNSPVTASTRKDCTFRNRLKNVKHALRAWSFQKFNKIDVEIDNLKKAAISLELKAEQTNLNDSELVQWRDLRKSWAEKEKIKNDMLKQKARIKWILEGDENTEFFS